MIVGTAGHIDHGKTALVKALTGTDADRLPEEKRRGITIELGYAYMPATDGGEKIGFIDMPGHDKLVHTMVAGAAGIDYALLLVAADDGVMPQTVEHLTILSLLGVSRGAAILTKIDRADEELLARRETAIRALLDDAGLEDWPILRVSAVRGDGVEALRTLLLAQAATGAGPAPSPDPASGFRMGLDRVFTLDGIGTVVAGSIAAGAVAVGDMLCLADAPKTTYRVRSLQVHGKNVDRARAGQRCAVGLAGLERVGVERGQLLCDPAIVTGALRLDVWLQVAATESRPLRSGASVHLHLGTRDHLASVAILGQNAIAPGGAGLAQLVLRAPAFAWSGEHFVLRDASAGRTVAGGAVVDPAGPERYRQTPQRLAMLDAQRRPDPAARLRDMLALAPFGIDSAAWLRGAGMRDWPFDPAGLEGVVFDAARGWAISGARLADIAAALTAALREFHARLPEDIGPDTQRARRLVAPRMPETLWRRLVELLVADGRLRQRNGFLHLPEHGIVLQAAEKVVAERAMPLLLAGGFDPPWVRDIAASTGLLESQVRQVLARMSKGGDVYQIVKDLYYHPRHVQALAGIARRIAFAGRDDGAADGAGIAGTAGASVPADGVDVSGSAGGAGRDGKPPLARTSGAITAAAFRDATGLGRKRAIQILEFFDRIAYLRRVGDVHLLRPGTTLFAGTSQDA